jgi:sugar-specific transcriptional regulator TrmB
MPNDLSALRAYFAKLNLEPEIGGLYIVLCLYGPQTISGLMHHSGVERTRIYRLRKAIENSGLFEIIVDNKREIFKAAPIDNLQLLLTKKEEHLQQLQSEFEEIGKEFGDSHKNVPLTHVQFHRGIDGLKQLFWNQTRAKTETLAILHHNMQNRTGSIFFNRWVRKCNEGQLHFRGVISDTFQADQESWYKTRSNERLQHWEQRTVPAAVLSITHSTIIHDDRVMFYNWNDSEDFGIEIYNTEIARAQRHLFEFLWQQGTPAKDVDAPKNPTIYL